MHLLDLPEEIISQILSQLPLTDLIPLSLTCRTLRDLSSTGLSPFSTVVDDALAPAFYPSCTDHGPRLNATHPTRHALATLGSYSHIHARAFLPLLIRAPLRWILDECQLPRLPAREWREAFEGRFLPSWKRVKQEGESWRACYLRTVRLLLHRQTGCSHEDVWTRFLMLNRNGSASLNRLYSRGFDPIASFEEIKNQHALSSHQSHVRLVLRLQDVRIIALGVRAPPSSVWVNSNAFALLHPPGLRDWETARVHASESEQEAAYPTSRSGIVQEGSGRGEIPLAPSARFTIKEEDVAGPSQIRRDQAEAAPDIRRLAFAATSRSTTTDATTGLRRLLRTRSRGTEGEDAAGPSSTSKGKRAGLGLKRWSLGGRTLSGNALEVPEWRDPAQSSAPAPADIENAVPSSPKLSDDADLIGGEEIPPDQAFQSRGPPEVTRIAKDPPYRPLRRPLPAASHRSYPNYPTSGTSSDSYGGSSDLRGVYETAMAPGAFYYGPRTGSSTAERDREDKLVDVEVDVSGEVQTWVGPMLLLAQLNLPHASSGNIDGPVSPAYPSLGASGSYVNLEWEDLDVIAPWISLQGDDGGAAQAGVSGGPGGYGIVEARRDGLGFGQ